MPCCRSMHSGAMSVVSRRPREGESGRRWGFAGFQAWGLEGLFPELDPHGTFPFLPFLRAVREFAASTECLLAGLADRG